MATASLSLSTLYPIHSSSKSNLQGCGLSLEGQLKISCPSHSLKRSCDHGTRRSARKSTKLAATEGSTKSSKSEETMPSWARPDSDEPPPWASNEGKESSQETLQIPFYAYLLASAVTAIAAIGSMFEYVNQKPVFGVINSDSIFYAPVLGFFVFSGVPTSAFLWYKSVQTANKEADEQDRRDGYR